MNADATNSLAAVLAEHQRRVDDGSCWCGMWPPRNRGETWMDHVADHLAQAVAADKAEAVAYWKGRAQEAWRREDRLANDLLIASSDKAKAVRAGRAEALREAADEMDAVIADGDCAEVAAHVPGEVGRSTTIDRRDALYNDPSAWLHARAEAEQGGGE